MIYMTICLISLVLIFFWDKDQRKNLIFNGTSSLHTALQRRKVRKSRMSLKDSNKYLQVKKSELRIQNPFFFPKRGVKIFNNVQKMGKFCHLPRTKISWKSKISGNAGSRSITARTHIRNYEIFWWRKPRNIREKWAHRWIHVQDFTEQCLCHTSIFIIPQYCLETTTIKI